MDNDALDFMNEFYRAIIAPLDRLRRLAQSRSRMASAADTRAAGVASLHCMTPTSAFSALLVWLRARERISVSVLGIGKLHAHSSPSSPHYLPCLILLLFSGFAPHLPTRCGNRSSRFGRFAHVLCGQRATVSGACVKRSHLAALPTEYRLQRRDRSAVVRCPRGRRLADAVGRLARYARRRREGAGRRFDGFRRLGAIVVHIVGEARGSREAGKSVDFGPILAASLSQPNPPRETAVMSVTGAPPKLLRFDTMLSSQLPTLARIEIQADDGTHSFLVKRDVLELIAEICLSTAAKLPKPTDLS